MDKRVEKITENGAKPGAPPTPVQTSTSPEIAQQRIALQMGQLILEMTRLQVENEQLRAALHAAREG